MNELSVSSIEGCLLVAYTPYRFEIESSESLNSKPIFAPKVRFTPEAP